MTAKELRRELGARNLNKSGNKAVLRDRLQSAMISAAVGAAAEQEDEERSVSSSQPEGEAELSPSAARPAAGAGRRQTVPTKRFSPKASPTNPRKKPRHASANAAVEPAGQPSDVDDGGGSEGQQTTTAAGGHGRRGRGRGGRRRGGRGRSGRGRNDATSS